MLGMVMSVADQGVSSAENYTCLPPDDSNNILGEKLRGDSTAAAQVLSLGKRQTKRGLDRLLRVAKRGLLRVGRVAVRWG